MERLLAYCANQSVIASAPSTNQPQNPMDQDAPQQELYIEPPTPHRKFDPHRRPAGANLEHVATQVIGLIEEHEKATGARKRARKAEDQRRFVEQVRALVADLAHCWLTDPEGYLDIGLSHRRLGVKNRYGADIMKESIADVVRAMKSDELTLIELSEGYPHPFMPKLMASTISPLPRLQRLFKEAGVTLDDLKRIPGEEVIILRGKKTGPSTATEEDYEDTSETHKMRQELQAINQWLSQANLYTDAQQDNGSPYDTQKRALQRIFNNGSFDEGGRLYGGFWQAMKKELREDVRIDEQSVVTLDFGQMLVRLLYAEAGVAIPFGGDAYLLPPLHMSWQEFNEYSDAEKDNLSPIPREGIKLVLTSAINLGKDQTRLPKGAREFIPNNYNLERVMKLVLTHHQPIAHFLGTGHGLRAMRKESDLLMDILLKLKEQEIVALPIHDAVIVPSMRKDEVQTIMAQVFHEHTGQDAVIKTE